jgi:hypothetical protein
MPNCQKKYTVPCCFIFTGCRSSHVNLEARSVGRWGTSRHCVVTRLEDITADQFRELRTKAGALFVMLPQHITSLLEEEKQVRS